MSMRPISIGSRGVAYKTTRGGKKRTGAGRCIDIYTTRTGEWCVIKDSATGADVKVRRGELFRVNR